MGDLGKTDVFAAKHCCWTAAISWRGNTGPTRAAGAPSTCFLQQAEAGQGTVRSELGFSRGQRCSYAISLPRGILPPPTPWIFLLLLAEGLITLLPGTCSYATLHDVPLVSEAILWVPFEVICAWLYSTQDAINHNVCSLLGLCSNTQAHVLLLLSAVPFQFCTYRNRR